ncbi:MAG: hypothetical protein ABFD79_12535 [Phycisphaerales bacterium]
MENLSRAAQKTYDELAKKMQDLVSADKKREPKLNEAEKNEINALETRIQYLEPRKDNLEKILAGKDARKKYIEENLLNLMIDKQDEIDALVNEYMHLGVATNLISEAFLANHQECELSKTKIGIIKERARARELREEA